MNNNTQKNITDVVWPWREADGNTQNIGVKRPRISSLALEVLIAGGFGCLFWFVFKKPEVAVIIFSIMGFSFLSGLFVPAAYYGFKEIFRKFAVGVGVAMTWLLLVPFFYLFFTAGRLLQLIFRKDPLNRKCPTDQNTYWIEHPENDIQSYSLQY